MNAQISFLDGTYSLIHIPLSVYTSLLQPILRTLLPQTQNLNLSEPSPEHELPGLGADSQQAFLNISVTPLECSIVCHTSWAKNVFLPVIAALPRHHNDAAKSVTVSHDQYMILSVISAGLDAAGRVMELSSPLALAGVPIFFITTYYSDFILVPAKERDNVTRALHQGGFALSENQNDFVNLASSSYTHRRGSSTTTTASSTAGTTNGSSIPLPPPSPPPSTVGELQKKTFELLRKRNIRPVVDPGLELVQCSGREISSQSDFQFNHNHSHSHEHGQSSWLDNVDTKLYTSIISVLVSQPRFLSLTLAQDDPPSLLLDKTLLPMFGDSLVGDTDSSLIPVFLDLGHLPMEVTGIVCGVAGRLVQDMRMSERSSELSYLSTARAGAVILPEDQARRALEILEPLLQSS